MIQRRALSLATSTNFIQMGQKHRQLFGQKFISNQWPTWNFQMRLLILGRWFGYILLSKWVKWCVILSLEEISDLLFTQFPTAATTATSASSSTCHFSGTPVFAFFCSEIWYLGSLDIYYWSKALCSETQYFESVISWLSQNFYSKQICPKSNHKRVRNFLDLSSRSYLNKKKIWKA